MNGLSLREYQLQYRGTSSTKGVMDALTQIQDDIVSGIRRIGAIDSKLLNMAIALNLENQALSEKVSDLESELDTAYTEYNAGVTDKLLVKSMYDPDAVLAGTANHNPAYGDLTLPHRGHVTRIPVIQNPDGDYEAIPGTLVEIDVTGTGSSYTAKDRNTTAYRCLDHSPRTFWIDERGTGATNILYRLTYPQPNNPRINVIVINPFPENNCEVTALQYNRLGSWSAVTGFPGGGITTKRMIHTEGVDISNQVRLTLRNNSSGLSDLGSNTVYPVGLQILDVGYIDFSSSGYAVVDFSVPGSGASYLTSLAATMSLNVSTGEVVSDYVRIQVFNSSQADWGSPVDTPVYDSWSDTYPHTTDLSQVDVRDGGSPVSNLYVKFTLTKVGDTTPVVRKIKMTYV